MKTIEITAAQLFTYLQFAIKFANKINTDLPEAKNICEELIKNLEKNLIINEMPF